MYTSSILDANLPLAGLRVIDAATYIAAPCAAAMLADFGAEVIKIERPPAGDPFRGLAYTPTMPRSAHNYAFQVDNRNKRSLTLNLGLPEGQEIFRKLVAQADVLVTNYQPQMQAKFKLRYEDLSPLNERLIYAMVTGYGDKGEEAEKAGYDMTAYWARSGLMGYLHNEGADPACSPCGFGDHPTSVSLFSAILLALYRRVQTGKGGKVWTTLVHNGVWSNASLTQAALCGDAVWPARQRRDAQLNPLVNHYRTADDRRVLFCLLDADRDWRKLCTALSHPEWIDDPLLATTDARRDNTRAVIALIDQAMEQKPLAEWQALFAEHDVLYGIVPSIPEVAEDRQLEVNGVFKPVEGAGFRTIDSPMHVDGIEKRPATLAPEIGQHSGEILRELGYADTEVETLRQKGVH